MKNTVAKIGEIITSPILIIFFINIGQTLFSNVLIFNRFIFLKKGGFYLETGGLFISGDLLQKSGETVNKLIVQFLIIAFPSVVVLKFF